MQLKLTHCTFTLNALSNILQENHLTVPDHRIMVHILHITRGGQPLFFTYSVVCHSAFKSINGFGVQFGNDHDCSSLPLLDTGIPLGFGKPWFISNFYIEQNCFFQWSTLAVSPVSPCTAQLHLVLTGWIPDGYTALCGIGWEISVRLEWWTWLFVVQRWMTWPVSGSWNSWRAWWRGGGCMYDGQTSLDWSRIVDTQVSLWSWHHWWCGVWYHRCVCGSIGEVSRERLIWDSLHTIARVGLHCSPHVTIYWRGVG